MALLAMLMLCICANAQSDPHIIGHVVDKKTQEHIPYVTIKLVNTTIATTTDDTGHYKLTNVPDGNYIIEASAVGYITASQPVTIKSNTTITVNFTIEEDALLLEQVVVTGNRSETKKRHSATLVNVVNREIFELIRKSEAWLKTPRPEVKIYKWNTKEWGEIPADFGRK